MPSTSKSQQRLFGMVHAYQKGKLKHAPLKVREIAKHISEEDAEHFAETRHEGLPERRGKERKEEKAAAWTAGFLSKCAEYGVDLSRMREKKAVLYNLKDDPTYEDVLKVFNKLDFDDRANLVPRHPDFLREVPDDMLFDRQVAVDGDGNPVGFQEFYLRNDKRGRHLPPHNIVAVAPEARGNGLARLMAEATVKKARKEKIKRLVWEAFADNEPSIRAALSAGFRDATPKKAKTYRKFVYDVEKDASAKKETWESGDGEVESYTPGKTEDHDEIVIRTKDGRRIRISNNTRLGKVLRARAGSRVGYHGWRIDGTNVVHKVHPNKRQRGGWLEHVKVAMSRDRIQAQYARHPQESLERLAARLARKKWGRRDVAREDAAHAEEFGITGEDKEYLDRYIIARIAERHDKKARLKHMLMRALWEKGHNGESFDDALPSRMARFRQYEDSPFGKYDNPIEQSKYDEWASKSDEDMDSEWEKYLKS